MIPIGYMLKTVVARPEWLAAPQVEDISSVSGCVSPTFAAFMQFWKNNGWWFYNSSKDIVSLCNSEHIDATGAMLFYYEAFEEEFDEETHQWLPIQPEGSFVTNVEPPSASCLIGYDLVTFAAGTSPECSPLSCNGFAADFPVNRHCLFDKFDDAREALESGKFDAAETGPYRIFAVYAVEAESSE